MRRRCLVLDTTTATSGAQGLADKSPQGHQHAVVQLQVQGAGALAAPLREHCLARRQDSVLQQQMEGGERGSLVQARLDTPKASQDTLHDKALLVDLSPAARDSSDVFIHNNIKIRTGTCQAPGESGSRHECCGRLWQAARASQSRAPSRHGGLCRTCANPSTTINHHRYRLRE